jgi:hypothetical protein
MRSLHDTAIQGSPAPVGASAVSGPAAQPCGAAAVWTLAFRPGAAQAVRERAATRAACEWSRARTGVGSEAAAMIPKRCMRGGKAPSAIAQMPVRMTVAPPKFLG